MTEQFVGIQVRTIRFADEGVGQVLDMLEELADVNAIVVAFFSFSEDMAGYANQGYYPCHWSRESFTLASR